VTYKANAGTCDKCGFEKTWETKISNPKSGKMMPAHIDDQGALLMGTGGCGKYMTPPVIRAATANGGNGASAGTIFEQKPATAAAPPAPARDTNSSDVILERIVALLRDISSDTQRIARKLDETFARLDERVQEARAK
jgi:hypothetical protein